ncbi:MAG: pyridoxal phosphate-dependent aminotransferase [Verrucomicrobiota bacterium]|nr:pyridoxal phosphate-dependent aminotransferase [Verrucomicrobiota bacterium]
MFGNRVEWSGEENPLTDAVNQRRKIGGIIYDLIETNPTAAGFVYDEAAIMEAFANPAALRYEPTARGLLCAREAVSRYYAERGWSMPADRILLTASTSEAYALLFKLLAKPGYEVLYPTPGYPLVEFLAQFEGLVAVRYRLTFSQNAQTWRIDFDRLAAAISVRTRALVVISPSNPTGNYLHAEDYDLLEELAAEHGFALIVDEVFYDFPAAGATRTREPRRKALTFVLNGLSKVCGLPQMKLGWVAVYGPLHLVYDALARLEYIADFYLSAGAPVQHAAGALLNTRHDLQRQINARLTTNDTFLRELCTQYPQHITLLPREGGWCSLIRCDDGLYGDMRSHRWLKYNGVLTHPAYYYDLRDDGLTVLSLLTPPDTFMKLGVVFE